METEDYPEVGRDYECDMCLENKVLGRLCHDCFIIVLMNHIVAFDKSRKSPREYIDGLIKQSEDV